jgi:hypothetical protein
VHNKCYFLSALDGGTTSQILSTGNLHLRCRCQLVIDSVEPPDLIDILTCTGDNKLEEISGGSMSTTNKVPTKQIIAGFKAIGSMKQYQHTWITGANLVELVVHHFLEGYEITVNKFNNAIHRHAELKLALSIQTKNPTGIFSDRYSPTSSG